MPNDPCGAYALGSTDRIRCAAGLLSGGDGTTTLATVANDWWKIVFGVIIIAVIIDVEPKLGGWLLLLIVLGLALSQKARSIITG